MRRFEYVGAKSSKFWEVVVSGSEVTTRWGRIGANGQTKTKEFASDAKAEAEAAKQIRSKSMKGYAEIAGSGAPQPAAAPAPPVVARPPSELEAPTEIAWTSKLRKTVSPKRADGPKAPKVSFTKYWKGGDRRRRGATLEMRFKSPTPSAIQALTGRAAAWLSVPEPSEGPLDLELAALGLAVQYGEFMVGALIDRMGLQWALEALVASTFFKSKWAPNRANMTMETCDDKVPNWKAWRILRAHIAASSLDDYTALRAWAEEVRNRHPVTGVLTATAYAFEDRDWAREATAADANGRHIGLFGLLPADVCSAIVSVIRNVNGVDAWVGDLLDNLGMEGAPVLAQLIDRASWEEPVAFIRAGSCVPSALIAASVVKKLDSEQEKKVRTAATKALLENPWTGIPALIGHGEHKALFKQMVRGNDEIAAALMDTLSGDDTAAIDAVRDTDRGPVADAAELPQLLVNPPWIGHKAPKRVRIAVDPVPWPGVETLDWKPGEAQRYRHKHDDWSDRAYHLEALAKHGLPALDKILANTYSATETVAGSFRVRSPRLAPHVAKALLSKSGRRVAQRWVEDFPDAAAHGLIPIALGKDGKLRPGAEIGLRLISAEVVSEVASRYPSEVATAIAALHSMDPLLNLPKKPPKLPVWFDPGAVTAPKLANGNSVPGTAVAHIATMMAMAPAEMPYAGIAALEDALTQDSRANFVWSLFEAWMAAGSDSKSDWALRYLGVWGDAETARKLTPFIRKWPGEAAHPRAVAGLDVLSGIGSDVALMHLHGISQKLKYKGLRTKAGEKIEEIADARGLTKLELADRLVPDCGLDPDGSRVLDFGPRSFKVGFSEYLAPFVVDGSGKARKSLPKPNQSDDAAKAKEAAAVWKAIKKDVRTVAKTQIFRLEHAMCAERRWDVGVFRAFIVDHPLMINLVRRLVWGVYTEGRLTQTFRVAEDRTFADREDDSVTLAADAVLGVPHALELDEAETRAWGEVLADYELIQPFAQLGRDTYAPEPSERGLAKLEVVQGKTVPWGKVVGLDKRGWNRGYPEDAGIIWEYSKPVGDYTAELELKSGLYAGALTESPDQELGAVTLRRRGAAYNARGATVGELSAVAYSELVRDLQGLTAGA